MAARSRTRQFFFRGLAIILPTVLTIWLLMVAYQFVADNIARPINTGVQWAVVRFSPLPVVLEHETQDRKAEIEAMPGEQGVVLRRAYRDAPNPKAWLRLNTKRVKLQTWWESIRIGQWVVMDLIGLVIAIILIYIVGVLLSGFIGRRIYHRGEELIGRVPLIRRVYPSVKQVTDFFVGDNDPASKFNRVVAVEYPRRGIWSVGLVTGETMRDIQNRMGAECLTVFIPSSPTPFTGYVITVPKGDAVDLSVSIEDALKFAVSLGVLVPSSQQISMTGNLFEPKNPTTVPPKESTPSTEKPE